MNINLMSRKQLEELNYINDSLESLDIDSIILLPTRKRHSSEFNLFQTIACNGREVIGKCKDYDLFDIIMESKYNRVGIDCLRGSGLMRIFLPANEYVIKPCYHKIVKREKEEWKD